MSLDVEFCACVCVRVCVGGGIEVSVYITHLSCISLPHAFNYGKRTKWPDNICIAPVCAHIYIHILSHTFIRVIPGPLECCVSHTVGWIFFVVVVVIVVFWGGGLVVTTTSFSQKWKNTLHRCTTAWKLTAKDAKGDRDSSSWDFSGSVFCLHIFKHNVSPGTKSSSMPQSWQVSQSKCQPTSAYGSADTLPHNHLVNTLY